MQTQMPIFPEKIKLINASVGLFTKDKQVFYLHNGSPIFCHDEGDKNNFRFVVANLVETGLAIREQKVFSTKRIDAETVTN